MNPDILLGKLINLGIAQAGASRRQTAIALAAKLTQLGDRTAPATLQRKAQAWVNGEDRPPALLGVVLSLLELSITEPKTKPARRKTA